MSAWLITWWLVAMTSNGHVSNHVYPRDTPVEVSYPIWLLMIQWYFIKTTQIILKYVETNGNHVENQTFSDYIINELSRSDGIDLNFIQSKLIGYEQFNQRQSEEKNQIINQLKQNLVDLTEKRFRALNNNIGSNREDHVDANSLNSNLQFVLSEKDLKIASLINEINENKQEINHLKATIKDQDNIILSHNSNIYVSWIWIFAMSNKC